MYVGSDERQRGAYTTLDTLLKSSCVRDRQHHLISMIVSGSQLLWRP